MWKLEGIQLCAFFGLKHMRRCGGSVGIFFRIFLLIESNRNFGFFAKFPANQRISPCKNVSAREHKPNHKNPFRVERMQSKNVALCYTQGSSRLSTTLSYLEKSRCSGVGCGSSSCMQIWRNMRISKGHESSWRNFARNRENLTSILSHKVQKF